MKGVIFVPSVAETEWIREILPDISPAELPVAGRRYIDYAIEHAQKCGFDMVEILDWHFSEKLDAEFSDLTRHTIPVFYQKGEGEMPKTKEDLRRQSSPLTLNMDDDITVIWGLCLAGFDIRSVADWHKLNMDILTEAGTGKSRFTLPGYSAEDGVFLGQNVIMEYGFEAGKNIMIQDNARCARNVRLDGLCIIGKGAFIDEGACLKRTVIGDDTYIGTGLEVVDKIIIGRRIIDAESGVWTDADEPGVASRIDDGENLFFRKILNFLFGGRSGK